MKVYIQWQKPTGAVITIVQPVCGTKVTLDKETGMQSNGPELSVTDGHIIPFDETGDGDFGGMRPFWYSTETMPPYFEGTITGGEKYTAFALISPEFGYYLDAEQISAENGTIVEKDALQRGTLLIEVEAVHDPDEPAIENETAPTCTKDGSHDEIVYCKACKAKLSEETVTDEALGHDWGEWIVTKEATVDEEGEKTHTCSRCDEKETLPIPKLEPEDEETITYTVTKGDGSTWTKGSTETCDFTYERSVNESETFSHFTGVKVDDTVIEESNYTAESGSVNISLQPSYLETLAAGEHTLTPTFDDGEADTATFTILEEDSEEEPSEDPDDSEEGPSENPDDSEPEPSEDPDDDGKNPN